MKYLNMKPITKSALLALSLLLSLSLLLIGCDSPAPEGDGTDPIADGNVTYTVTVLDPDGAPVPGVGVQFCDDNGCRMPMTTNAEGVVTLSEAKSNFHITIVGVPEGFATDSEEYHFGDAFELTVTLTAE